MWGRLLRGLLAGLVLALAVAFGAAPTASAAYWDEFDSWMAQATLNPDGTVDVVETVTLRFGESSGRHGLERTLRTREPDKDTGQDMVFPVTNIAVESLSPGVSDELDISHHEVNGNPRETYVRIRVGDPDRTISADTASYRVKYTIAGLMRSPDGVDQLYWDMTGSSMPEINNFVATITVPGGAQQLFCSSAAPGSARDCTSQSIDAAGRAIFIQDSIWRSQLLTVGVRVTPGLVTPNTPLFEENAQAVQQRQSQGLMLGSAAGGAVVFLGGLVYLRGRTGDRRYQGLPPGVLPAPGQPASEGRSSKGTEIPVAFAPPRLAVAEAGRLLHGASSVKHTTATLVSLAVNGAIRLRSEPPPQARLIDHRAANPVERALLDSLFVGTDVTDLSGEGSLTAADRAVRTAVDRSAKTGGWFLERGKVAFSGCTVLLLVPMIAGAAMVFFGGWLLNLWPLVVAVVVTAFVLQFGLSRPRRSAVGRALTDQVEGFRTYLATAEAEQLRFEEGEDIFSKYLPWAILFDLTERWTKVCEKLVAMGRLSGDPPAWYYGSTWDLHNMGREFDRFGDSVATAASPPAPPPSSSDSSFGSSSSSFSSGGGFSGGGGGGGGGGSW